MRAFRETPDPDAGLAEALVRREPAALAELYDRFGRPAYSLARRVLGDDQLAEDVVQEVFEVVWSDVARFDAARGRLGSWLLTITHHRAVDAVRREQSRRRHTDRHQALAVTAGSADEVSDQVAASLQGRQVRAALDALPTPQREALTLAYFGGYTQAEIAQRIGIPLGTVKTRTLAGMRALRAVLDDPGEQPGEASPGTDDHSGEQPEVRR